MKVGAEPRNVVPSPEQQELMIRLMYDRADAALVNKAAARAIAKAIAVLHNQPAASPSRDDRLHTRLH